jgi:hypothetical protein
MVSVVMLSVIMREDTYKPLTLSVVMLSVVMLIVVMLSVVMLSVVMLNFVMLSVVAPLNSPAQLVNIVQRGNVFEIQAWSISIHISCDIHLKRERDEEPHLV